MEDWKGNKIKTGDIINVYQFMNMFGGTIPEKCFLHNGYIYQAEYNYYLFPLLLDSKK